MTDDSLVEDGGVKSAEGLPELGGNNRHKLPRGHTGDSPVLGDSSAAQVFLEDNLYLDTNDEVTHIFSGTFHACMAQKHEAINISRKDAPSFSLIIMSQLGHPAGGMAAQRQLGVTS